MTHEPTDDRATVLAKEALAEIRRMERIIAILDDDKDRTELLVLAISTRIERYGIEIIEQRHAEAMAKLDASQAAS